MSVRILAALVPLALGTFIVLRYDLAASAASYAQNFPLFGLAPTLSNSGYEPQPYTRHIVAVGDLHGDWMNARKVLHFSGVINDKDEWSGDVDFFAQTGDIIDRGPDTIKLFTFMDELRAQAQAQGAVVLSHLGNHEWMNALGDWRYVYPTELATFESTKARQAMLSTGAIGRSWAANYTTASRLPLHPSLGPPNTPYPSSSSFLPHHESPLSHSALSFVHGGLSPTYSNLSPFPTRINEISDSLLHKLQSRPQPDPHPPGPYAGLPNDATADEQELYESNGPLWYRGWAQDSEAVVCKAVAGVLQKTGTRRMIMGHTPDFDNITSRCGGKIIIIDTGISRAYGGVLSALSIHYTLTPVGKALHPSEQEWEEREVVSALYEDRQEILTDDIRRVVGDFATS